MFRALVSLQQYALQIAEGWIEVAMTLADFAHP
jgi:hypothetical protein